MALKYFFEYQTKNIKPDNTFDIITNRCEIYNDDFVGDATEIKGSVTLTKVSDNDILKPTRGGGLKIQLEANTDLTFDDFQTDNERVFSVKYFMNTELLFYGWLSPEGLYEDYISNEWAISLDCTDGIGFLNNLSYVDNTTEELFTGKQSMLEVIVNCLKRTGLDMNIYTSIAIYQNEVLTFNDDTFAESYINANRYIKDDNITTMSCKDVLTSILELFGAVITQYKGGWYIYKPNELYEDSELEFFGYDEDGVALSPAKYTIDFEVLTGSQNDNYYPHHINANQRITLNSSLGSYRINYKYGFVKSFFENIYLESVLTPPSIEPDVDEWTINDYTNLTFPTDDKGFVLDTIPYVFPLPSTTLLATSDSFTFTELDCIVFHLALKFNPPGIFAKTRVDAYFKVILDDSGTLYYLTKNGEWTTTDTLIDFVCFTSLNNITVTSENMPVGGSVYIEIYRPIQLTNQGTIADILLLECGFSPKQDQEFKGEIFTFKNTSNNSTKITETKEVFNGDSASDVYVGTIYESDQVTPSEKWYRNDGYNQLTPLVQIMGEERMAMNTKTSKTFTGDFFGYIDFLSVISINNFTQKFMPIEYSYDSANNITKTKLIQIQNENNGGSYIDVDVTSYLDDGNVEEPTI